MWSGSVMVKFVACLGPGAMTCLWTPVKIWFCVLARLAIIKIGGVSKSMLTLNEAIIDVKKG
jgi:hypothetical protein